MIKRDKYLQQLVNNKNNGFPKIITGIRRCGKSFLLKEIYRKYLIDNDVPKENILILELDDDRNSKYRNPLMLGEYVREFCKGKENCYVFLDEIQKVFTIVNPVLVSGEYILANKNDTETISFVDVVLGLSREENIDLYITGSNSKMLSSDIVTEFRDKAVEINLMPLSFKEFYEYKGGSKTEAIYEYMQYGGMPLAVLKNEIEKKEYLKSLFETTYFMDIIERNGLRKGETLDELCNIISASTGNLINSTKIANSFKSRKNENIDRETIDKYIKAFLDAFILRETKRYDLKGKTEIGALKKYYFVDTGLRNARLNFAYQDEGQLLENVIYNELIYRGFTVNVGSFDSIEKDKEGKSTRKTNEVDFFARKANRQYYIQATADISNAETRAREIRPYIMLNDQIKKIIVVNKPIPESLDENGFLIIGATNFLLDYINN